MHRKEWKKIHALSSCPWEKARKERVGIMPWPSANHFSVYASVVPEAYKYIVLYLGWEFKFHKIFFNFWEEVNT